MSTFECRRCDHEQEWHTHFSDATHCSMCAECNVYVGPTLAERARAWLRSLWA